MVARRHNGDLLAENDNAATDCDEYLTHDKIPDACSWVAEIYHQALTEDIYRHSDVQQPFEVSCLANN